MWRGGMEQEGDEPEELPVIQLEVIVVGKVESGHPMKGRRQSSRSYQLGPQSIPITRR